MAKKAYDIGYTNGKHEHLILSDEEVRLLRFNKNEDKVVSTILPIGYDLYTNISKRQRSYAR